MNFSIHTRILFSALITLTLFMGLTGAVLDSAFRNNLNSLQQENLRTQIYTLLAAAELDVNDNFILPQDMTEPRLNLTESTLHARVISDTNKIVWQSKSMLNMQLPFTSNEKMGEFSFRETKYNKNDFTLVTFTTQWITDKNEQTYIFQVAENKKVINSQITLYRKNLWGWLAGVSFILIIIQTFILHWGLKPLRYVADDLLEIEKGNEKRLTSVYPKEITPLTQNLNQLLDSSQQQLIRYRDALGNMAHSLKTPIAVLQGIISSATIKEKQTATEQLHTINSIVDYQLQRAATVGRLQLANPVSLRPAVDKIINTLHKVYRDKKVEAQINIPDSFEIKIDEGDLYEMLGNLIENAFKWCKCKISIHAEIKNNITRLCIEDDGPGISEDKREVIQMRGQRADQFTPGHGLGLAMVNDMLLLYQGSIKITKSSLGGAKIVIQL